MPEKLSIKSNYRIITSQHMRENAAGLYPVRGGRGKERTVFGMEYYAEILNAIAISGKAESTVDIIVTEDFKIKAVYIDKLNAIFNLDVLKSLIKDHALVLIGAEDKLGFRRRFHYATRNADRIDQWMESGKLDPAVLSVELNFGNAEKALESRYDIKAYDRPHSIPETFLGHTVYRGFYI